VMIHISTLHGPGLDISLCVNLKAFPATDTSPGSDSILKVQSFLASEPLCLNKGSFLA